MSTHLLTARNFQKQFNFDVGPPTIGKEDPTDQLPLGQRGDNFLFFMTFGKNDEYQGSSC